MFSVPTWIVVPTCTLVVVERLILALEYAAAVPDTVPRVVRVMPPSMITLCPGYERTMIG
jgi:hypothetical protein